jgi:hypothetical protein
MDKKIIGALGAASALALAAGGSAIAAPGAETPSLRPAQSFAELLDPIPNATATLIAEDQKPAETDEAPVQLAQYHHHHHHHHHHHWYHHHHHHHHWWRRHWHPY